MIISALVLVPGTYSLIKYGLRQSIDFTGGTLVELKTDEKTVKIFSYHNVSKNIIRHLYSAIAGRKRNNSGFFICQCRS